MAQVVSLFPLFPGTNEMDQIEKIHAITGTPSPEILATMKRRSTHVEFEFPHKVCSLPLACLPLCVLSSASFSSTVFALKVTQALPKPSKVVCELMGSCFRTWWRQPFYVRLLQAGTLLFVCWHCGVRQLLCMRRQIKGCSVHLQICTPSTNQSLRT